ncbi:hypothetical protein ABIF99_010101 [Bradyrhizobium japonicum]|nr:hypothetical protein [Bradyrhizobium japonicum]MCP1855991.1 hypothetical protein [Bradyrhizobium japonicum]MCP1897194.1 hypothetical protein [Bradyrhizobium japonicum]MCW2330758.1 hypothetical protein [Bradyrhizobium japonicum]
MKASITFTKKNATEHGKRLMALAVYRRGKSFIGAAVLLNDSRALTGTLCCTFFARPSR